MNDISFHRLHTGRVAELAYSVEGEQLGEVRCDGLVVATPAGSTGYNLANGGPVLAWGVEGYVVSFIARTPSPRVRWWWHPGTCCRSQTARATRRSR